METICKGDEKMMHCTVCGKDHGSSPCPLPSQYISSSGTGYYTPPAAALISHREYKCGNCGGEFDRPLNEAEKKAHKTTSICPFCKGKPDLLKTYKTVIGEKKPKEVKTHGKEKN